MLSNILHFSSPFLDNPKLSHNKRVVNTKYKFFYIYFSNGLVTVPPHLPPLKAEQLFGFKSSTKKSGAMPRELVMEKLIFIP
tara:strand:- start:126 stop:371 length:246 start_codon:yes stop_codon:yes gene_type:complete